MTKYEELENKIKELQEEVDRLKKEERNPLPGGFNRQKVLDILNGKEPIISLYSAFEFNTTEQGYKYWSNIAEGRWQNWLDDQDIIRLQEWVILSYQREFGK